MQTLIRHRLRSALAPIVGRLRPRHLIWLAMTKYRATSPIIVRLGRSGNLKIRIYGSDVLGRNIYVHGFSEPAEAKFISSLLKPGMVFVDVCANAGEYTLIAAQKVGPGGRVHSFEPSHRMFDELVYNVGLNGLQDRCTLNAVAVVDSVGTAALSCYKPGAEVYGSLGTQNWAGRPIVGHQLVNTVTLDAYLSANNVGDVDVIKLDVEGAELPVLRGAAGLLSQEPGPTLLVEMADLNTAGFGYKALEIWALLETCGYRVYALAEGGRALRPAVKPRHFGAAKNLIFTKHALA